MWLVTLPMAIALSFGLEAALGRFALWRWLRWALLPPLGVFCAVGVPIVWFADVPWFDGWLMVGAGAAIGALAAIWGAFRHLLRPPRMTLYDLNGTGMRSALIRSGRP